MEKNLYEELGLKKNATRSEIKSSYRSLVKQHHPDAGGKKERFLAIQNAWETLNDPIKKKQYDSSLFSSSSSFDSLNENWEETFNSKKYNLINRFENQLNKSNLVSKYSIIKITNKKTIYKIIYNNSPDRFIKNFRNKNFKINTNNNIWDLN